jgi:hypothetical protein
MKDEILLNIDNPVQLENLYRSNKSAFRQAFTSLYPELGNSSMARFWHARLNFGKEALAHGSNEDLLFVMVSALVAGAIAKLPALLHINEEFFYSRNIGFILFPVLSMYFAWKNKLSPGKTAFMAATMLAGLLFINSLPNVTKSDTLALACIHLPICLWSVLGFVFVGEQRNSTEKRLGFLQYNGDLLVITTLIVIAGAILSGVTIALFTLIGINIREFYIENIVFAALPAAPIIGTYLTQTNPQLVGKVSPVIAKIFSPLVLVMLVIYLIAIVYSGKDPYNDREFLLVFNALLIGVMAIIFFSVAEASGKPNNTTASWVLLLLAAVTVLVNGIALSAILFRIASWGITPNRAAVLGSNVLILLHLLLVLVQLYRVAAKKAGITRVEKTIAFYLPVYCVWAAIVTFIFPFLFGFR